MLVDTELSRRFSLQDEAEARKQRLTENRQMSLSEYVDDMQKSDDTGGTSVAGNNGNTGSEPVINPEREKT